MRLPICCLVLLTLTAPARGADPLVWWRFEDVPPGQWLTADMGSRRRPFTTTADASGHGHGLRTFNTNPTLYPPDTSPEFQPDIGPTTVDGGTPNVRSAHFTGHQYLFTTDDRADAPLYAQRGLPFTIEGLFKIAARPEDWDGRPQTVLCKGASPVVDPVQLAAELNPMPTTRPATQATSRPATMPATTRSTTRPATTRTTRPAYEGSTERVNDHPVQPFVCYVQGTNAWPNPAGAPVNTFVVVLVDAANHRHVLRSDRPIDPAKWYAFAVVFDGTRATLLLTDPGTDDYRPQGRSAPLPGGMYACRGAWMVGCGLLDDVRQNWWQGWIDEVRISSGAIDEGHLIAANTHAAQGPPRSSHGGDAPRPESVIDGLADPEVLLDGGIYYCYGTRDQVGFPVYTSTDLLHWERGPEALQRHRGQWAVNRYWAPSPVKYRGRYYLFYSALGHVAAAGERWSHRVNVGVAGNPEGPFEPHAGPLPLIGKAVIDPSVCLAADGHVYLYFVADMSENEISQVFAARMNDDLTGIVGEPTLCIQPSQVWEGKFWNEGPHVFHTHGVYVMTYSAQFWHSPEYGVGFATSRSPTGPWTKNPANPILQRWRGLFGSGGDGVVPMPNGTDYAIVFHADGPPGTQRRDTYVDKLTVTPDPRLGVMLRPEAWSPPTP